MVNAENNSKLQYEPMTNRYSIAYIELSKDKKFQEWLKTYTGTEINELQNNNSKIQQYIVELDHCNRPKRKEEILKLINATNAASYNLLKSFFNSYAHILQIEGICEKAREIIENSPLAEFKSFTESIYQKLNTSYLTPFTNKDLDIVKEALIKYPINKKTYKDHLKHKVFPYWLMEEALTGKRSIHIKEMLVIAVEKAFPIKKSDKNVTVYPIYNYYETRDPISNQLPEFHKNNEDPNKATKDISLRNTRKNKNGNRIQGVTAKVELETDAEMSKLTLDNFIQLSFQDMLNTDENEIKETVKMKINTLKDNFQELKNIEDEDITLLNAVYTEYLNGNEDFTLNHLNQVLTCNFDNRISDERTASLFNRLSMLSKQKIRITNAETIKEKMKGYDIGDIIEENLYYPLLPIDISGDTRVNGKITKIVFSVYRKPFLLDFAERTKMISKTPINYLLISDKNISKSISETDAAMRDRIVKTVDYNQYQQNTDFFIHLEDLYKLYEKDNQPLSRDKKFDIRNKLDKYLKNFVNNNYIKDYEFITIKKVIRELRIWLYPTSTEKK